MSKISNAVALIVSMAGASIGAAEAGPVAGTESGTLSQALRDYGEQRHQTLIYTEDLVAGLQTPDVSGPTPELTDLLSGTGLVAERSPSGAWMIRRPAATALAGSPSPSARPIRLAQQGAPAAASTGVPTSAAAAGEVDEIVVTGSRVARDGFSAPTPTTVVGAAELQQRGANNAIEAINEIPAFRPSQTPAAAARGGGSGGSFLDLRGLNGQGGNAVARTLVLVDGRRFVTSNPRGQVDVALIPNSLIERTEVVTGGASAAWGSDAVAGVVNFILKDRLQGVETSVSYGASVEGDNQERAVSLAAGTSFAGDRGHVILGGEYVDQRGVPDSYVSRDWGRLGYGQVTLAANRAAGLASRLIAQDVRLSDRAAPGGIIVGTPGTPSAAFDNIQFLGGQATSLFVPGSVVGGNQMVGGGPDSNPGVYFTGGSNLINPVERYAALGRATFDLTDNVSTFVELSHGQSRFRGFSASRRDDASLTINRNNAFLPTSVSAAMLAAGLTTVTVGRVAYDDNYNFYKLGADQKTDRIVLGFKGKLFEDWSWDAYAEWGQNKFDQFSEVTINSNYLAAVNAIRDVNGNIVCNPAAVPAALGAPDPGCVPFNWVGRNSPSDAAVAYVRNVAENFQTTQQRAAAVNITGEPFTLWAGPVSLAGGLEYRKESVDANVDANSLASRFDLANFKPLKGDYDTKELYLETVVPLLKDVPLAQSLELNAAARRTDYSTSGAVTTWKVGLGWEPVADVRLRATQSRDIRAPNLAELFTSVSAVGRGTVQNLPNSAAGIQVDILTLGNPDLQPEAADTLTAGVLYQPSWLPGLRASVDYFDIKIEDVITALAADQTVLRCAAGVTSLCANIDRDANGNIFRVRSRQQNFNLLETDGLDFELGYNLPPEMMGIPGQFGMRAFGTFVNELTTIDVTGTFNRVKQTVPKWSANFNLNYTLARLSAQAQVRFIGKTVTDVTFIGPDDPGYNPALANSINFNERKKVFYLNLSGQFRFIERDGLGVQVFGVVNNVFDKDPQPFAANNPVGASLFDLVGRAYKVGVRVNF